MPGKLFSINRNALVVVKPESLICLPFNLHKCDNEILTLAHVLSLFTSFLLGMNVIDIADIHPATYQ